MTAKLRLGQPCRVQPFPARIHLQREDALHLLSPTPHSHPLCLLTNWTPSLQPGGKGAEGAAESLHHTACQGFLHFLRTCLCCEWSTPSLSFERGVHVPSSPPSVALRLAHSSGSKSLLLWVLQGPRLPAPPASPHCAQTPPPQCPGHAFCRLQFSVSPGQAQQVTCFLRSSVTVSPEGGARPGGHELSLPPPMGPGASWCPGSPCRKPRELSSARWCSW